MFMTILTPLGVDNVIISFPEFHVLLLNSWVQISLAFHKMDLRCFHPNHVRSGHHKVAKCDCHGIFHHDSPGQRQLRTLVRRAKCGRVPSPSALH